MEERFSGGIYDEKVYSETSASSGWHRNALSNASRSSITALSSAVPLPPPEPEEEPDGRMTKAKWLAAISLAIAYTTAFQQGSTTASILKSINEEIGRYFCDTQARLYQG